MAMRKLSWPVAERLPNHWPLVGEWSEDRSFSKMAKFVHTMGLRPGLIGLTAEHCKQFNYYLASGYYSEQTTTIGLRSGEH